jgi:hypothetical protein
MSWLVRHQDAFLVQRGVLAVHAQAYGINGQRPRRRHQRNHRRIRILVFFQELEIQSDLILIHVLESSRDRPILRGIRIAGVDILRR